MTAGPAVPGDVLGPLRAVVTAGVTDVLVNGPGQVWVDGPEGLRRAVVPELDAEPAVRALAVRLAAAGGRRLDEASPAVDARLAGGVRLHAVLPVLAPAGTHLSLRIGAARPLSLADLVARGSLDAGLAAQLADRVAGGAGVLVSGLTGAGKTTVLAALLALAGPGERIVVVEDSAELVVDHPHVVRLEARPANVEGAGAVGLGALVRQALRMRPDRLVVGECRGDEVRDLLSAWSTGHRAATTLHAAGPDAVASRVATLARVAGLDPGAALAQLGQGDTVVVHVERTPDGRRVRGMWPVGTDGRLARGSA